MASVSSPLPLLFLLLVLLARLLVSAQPSPTSTRETADESFRSTHTPTPRSNGAAVGGNAYKPALWYNPSSTRNISPQDKGSSKQTIVSAWMDAQQSSADADRAEQITAELTLNRYNVFAAPSPTLALSPDTTAADSDIKTNDDLFFIPSPSFEPKHAADGNVHGFKINENFVAAPLPLFVRLPERLVDSVVESDLTVSTSDTTSLSRQGERNDSRISSIASVKSNDATVWLDDTDCTGPKPTQHCCTLWYIPETLQHKECMAGSGDNENDENDDDDDDGVRSDMFNVKDESRVDTCLYRDPQALHACCTWLEDGDGAATERCIRKRRNILSDGIRVCVVDDPTERMSCCVAIFKGRTFLYERCVRGVPTFINRQAPCVFKDLAAQDLCCQQIFPSVGLDGTNRAYSLCANVVSRKTSTVNVCYEEDSAKREECCEQEKLYGIHPYDQCMGQDVPPCRLDNFIRREKCCHVEFPDKAWRRKTCMVREFKRCQLNGWEDRLACCSSLYRVGSLEMKKCVYQYIHVTDVFLEQERIVHCGYRYPPGSQHFEDCLFYPIRSCQLIANGDVTKLETCCADYFQMGVVGVNVCMGKTRFPILFSSYLDFDESWKPLSNTSHSPETRVSYCLETFGLKSERWARYACLSEITFNATDPSLYHFTLFSDTAVVGHAQFACAIYDELERESCCAVSYPGASQSFETCMSWQPTLGYTDYEDITENQEMQLETQLTDALQNPLTASPPSLDTAEQSNDRERVRKFLVAMKRVEERLSKQNGAGRFLKSESIATQAYYEFRTLFRVAVAKNETGTFYHGAAKSWMTCTLMRLEMASDDTGVLYCGKLAVINEEKVPRRKPVLGWEGGALRRIVAHISSKSSVRLPARRAAAARRAPMLARQTETESSGEAVAVNLFGDAAACPLANLALSCNALCCDSFFAECWLCQWQNLQCVGSGV